MQGDRHIGNVEDLIDTRDVLARIDWLKTGNVDDDDNWLPVGEQDSPDDVEECQALIKLLDETRSDAFESPENGFALIRESYFVDYIKDEYMEVGQRYYTFNPDTYRHELVDRREMYSSMPFDCIDWKAVAGKHSSDYDEVNFDGVTYFYFTG